MQANPRTRGWPWQSKETDWSTEGQGGSLGLRLSEELCRGPGISSHQDLKCCPILQGPHLEPRQRLRAAAMLCANTHGWATPQQQPFQRPVVQRRCARGPQFFRILGAHFCCTNPMTWGHVLGEKSREKWSFSGGLQNSQKAMEITPTREAAK